MCHPHYLSAALLGDTRIQAVPCVQVYDSQAAHWLPSVGIPGVDGTPALGCPVVFDDSEQLAAGVATSDGQDATLVMWGVQVPSSALPLGEWTGLISCWLHCQTMLPVPCASWATCKGTEAWL